MRFLLARHGETVYNRDARMQGNTAHTPLTRAGIAQAEAIGAALACALADSEEFDIWCSSAGRALQTAAIVAEHLGRDFFTLRPDARLREMEIGSWEQRRYAEIVAAGGEIVCPERRIFTATPPGGETYSAVAHRLAAWLDQLTSDRTVVTISHGMTLRVLRGRLSGGSPVAGVSVAADAPQGSIVEIFNAVEKLIRP